MPIKKKYRCKSPRKGEAGFTLIEMVMVSVLTSILGIFIFGVLTKCLVAQRDMQVRKEMSDAAVRTMDKVNRELREASVVHAFGNNVLMFTKKYYSSADSNPTVAYLLISGTMKRMSAADEFGPWNFANGSVIATGMKEFVSTHGLNSRYTIQMKFESTPGADDGAEWITYVLPRNL